MKFKKINAGICSGHQMNLHVHVDGGALAGNGNLVYESMTV